MSSIYRRGAVSLVRAGRSGNGVWAVKLKDLTLIENANGAQLTSFRPLGVVTAFRFVLIAGFLLTIAANQPGHMSFDSVVQLHEGRTHVRDTWAPAIYSAILGGFDRVVPGTGLYLVASVALVFGSLLALRKLRPTMAWTGPLAAILVVFTPDFLIGQGAVWKDVLFANLAVAAFVLLALVAKTWVNPRVPWVSLLGIVLLLAIAAQVRQNGLIATAFAALVLAWTARSRGLRSVVLWGSALFLAVVVLSQVLGQLSLPSGSPRDTGFSTGLRVLQRYDIVGVAARDTRFDLAVIGKANPEIARDIRTRGVPLLSPARWDSLHGDPVFLAAFKSVPAKVINHQWWVMISEHPVAYLKHRLEVFRWVFLTPMIDSCMPIFVGVEGPAQKIVDLKMSASVDANDQRLYNYGTWFLDTPVYSHLSYALICVGTAVVLLLRREPQDMAIVGLMFAALGFLASFFVISISCDYRYLYFVDLAALVGLVYLAIDPPLAALGLGRPK